MNASSEPRRCPACSAEIPAEAPQGLCPKCLLLGVASVAEPLGNSEGFAAGATSQPGVRAPSRAANDSRPAPPSIDELAAAFPQLEIIELIGRGGMGFVYKARQPKLDRFVALKILPGHLASEPSFHERFEREARVLAKLQHPLIVSVYDFGEATTVVQSLRRLDAESRSDSATAERAVGWDQRRFAAPAHHDVSTRPDGGPALEASLSHPTNTPDARSYFYLMLEYVDGVNLREAMRAGRFTPDQALAIVPQVCEALQYAHSKGVLHRDIKPENILLDTEGRVKIADFGIAKVLGPEIDESSSLFSVGGASESELAVTRLTAPGSVLGTPLYMAPEQLFNPNAVDHRADIFSLGVVFYEMLTGELPMGRFAPPSEKSLANQQIDQRIDEVVLRALAKERELRQQSAGEMKTEVETISASPRRNPVPPPVPVAASLRPTSTSSGATGGSFEPPVRVKNTVEPVVPGWLLWDVGRVLIAMIVVSFLSVAIPMLLMVVIAPIWILDLIVFGIVSNSVEQVFQPWSYAQDAGQFVAVIACVVIDAALLYAIWRRWLRHFSPRRAGASLRWLFTPYSEEQAPSSGQTNSKAKASGAADGSFEPPVNAKRTGERSPSPVPPDVKNGNTSGSGGWWALFALFIGTPLPMFPMIGIRAARSVDLANIPAPPSPVWIALMITLMMMFAILILFTVGGFFAPIWLGWRHLFRQHRDHSRNGIIPALIAAYFLPLLVLDVAMFFGIVGPLNNYPFAQLTAMYVAVSLCVIVDGTVLYATWCWVRYSPWRAQPSSGREQSIVSLVTCLAVLAIVVTVIAFLPLVAKLAIHSSPTPQPGVKQSPVPHSQVETGTAAAHGAAATRTATLAPPQAVSAAEAEAKRLGLIRVADASSGVDVVQQPIGLKGAAGEVFVEPHFSALVELPEPTNLLTFTIQTARDSRGPSRLPVDYPCDYIACDWTLGTDKPRIMGYLLPPGAYDFRGDAETNKHLTSADLTIRALVASHTLKLISETELKRVSVTDLKSMATESDWQQATQAAHLRFKLVPKSLSKLNVPDECLVVLTDKSRTLFTRESGRFTRHELTSDGPIRVLRESFGAAVNFNNEADVKLLLDKAHRAVKQQNWEELLTCLTDDGRDEWIFEITTGSSLAMTMLEKQGGVAVLKAIPQRATLTQLGDELKKLSREPTTEEGKLLDQRYQNYSKLSAADRRQLRIDVMRANYPDMARVATTTLTFDRQLDEQKLVIDFSAINDLHIEGDRATGTWGTTDGKLNPIVIRRVEVNGKHVWKIDSLIGKSVIDPPFAVSGFPAELMLEASEPDDPDSPEDAPADASAPENVPDEEDSAES